MLLAKDVYLLTRAFPREELYGTVSHRKSAGRLFLFRATSLKGQVRLSKREFKQFLGIARASLLELETQLFIAKDLDYLKQGELEDLLARTSELLKMLNGLISSISPN